MTPIQQAKQLHALLKDWFGDGAKAVPKPLAQSRADVCLGCPHNDGSRAIEEAFKGAALIPIRKMIEARNQMRLSVNGEAGLHLCGICDCVLKLKIHVPIEHIIDTTEADTLNKFPDFCWIKKGIKED